MFISRRFTCDTMHASARHPYPAMDKMPIIQSSLYSVAEIHDDHSGACRAHVGQQHFEGSASECCL